MPAPSTPTNFYVQQGNEQVYLSWDQSAGATTYPIYKSTDNVTYTLLASPAVNNYFDTVVTVGTTYYYKIQADNGSASPFTDPQSTVPTKTGEMSLGELRLLAQQRADRVNSNFVTLPEWNANINQSILELYDLLVTTYEDYYLAAPYQFTTDGSAMFDLPPDFYKLAGVDLGQSTTNDARVTVGKFDFIARNRYVYPNITSTFYGVFNLKYRLMGSKLHFIPVPSAGQIITVWYVPRLAKLLADSDILDGISGWTEYIIVDAALKALQKEESDVTVLAAEKMALIKRIEESAMNRDVGQPDTISSIRNYNARNGGWGGPNGDGSFGGY